MSSCRIGFLVAPAPVAAPNAPNGAVDAAGAEDGALNWNAADEEGGGPAGVVEGTALNVNGFAGVAAVALELVNENAVEVPFVTAPVLEAKGLLTGCPARVKLKLPVAEAAGVDALESGLGFDPGGAPNVNGPVAAGRAGADVNGKPEAESGLIGLLPASLSATLEGVLNPNGLFVGVTVPDVLPNSGWGFVGVSAGVVEAGAMKGKPGLLSGEGVAAGTVVLSAVAGGGAPKVNGIACLGSTGVGNGVEEMPNGKALLEGSAVAVVGVGRLNLNPSVLVAEAGAGVGTSASGATGGAPKVKAVVLVVLESPIDPVAGKSNSLGATGLYWSPPFRGGNDDMLIEGVLVGGVAVEAGADSFEGDPLSISSSRVSGGVPICSRVVFAGVGCGLGAAVGAVNTIIGAGAERVIGAVRALNSGTGLV